MTPLKNGVNVYFINYGMMVRADIYKLDTVYIIRWNNLSIKYTNGSDAGLIVQNIENDGLWFHRDDLGITIVPERFCARFF